MRNNQIANHLEREEQCRDNAAAATDVYIKRIHIRLAELHAARRVELERRIPYVSATLVSNGPARRSIRAA
ncbi:hypothetical protein HRJ34_00115 [Rhizorhabdus wittichii]|uniref:Uncharacterized protein n=1 Tax=Rhizorhabdus wittichii TaxID=160791 RepID=A0A975D3J4_9SPHN|nr:hypothetical protein HRJ34_00115 [Rhizorhabdus wittichii]